MGLFGTVAKGAVKGIDEIQQGVRDRAIPAVDQRTADDIQHAAQNPQPVEPGRTNIPGPGGRNISLKYATTTDDIMSIIDTAGAQNDDFLDARRGVVSHEQTLQESGQFTLKDLLGRKPGAAFSAAQVTGARRILIDSADRIAKASDLVTNGIRKPDGSIVTASESDLLAFRQMVAQHAAIQAQVAGMTAEAGRALNAFRIQAQGGFLNAQEMSDVLAVGGGADAARKLAKLITEAEGDPQKIAKITRDTWHATSGDMFIEYWLNGLLSSFTTDAANVLGNAIVTGMSIPERLLAAGFSKVMRSPEGYQAGEAAAMTFGAIRHFMKAWSMSKKAFLSGEPSDPMMKLEQGKYHAISGANVANLPMVQRGRQALSSVGMDDMADTLAGPFSKGVDLLGDLIRLPGRFLTAEDEFFKAWNYGMELEAQAFRKATQSGKDGDELAAVYRDAVNNPSEEVHQVAYDHARYNTFTNDLESDFGKGLQRLANSHPLAKMILPFVRTPTNIIKYVGARTPLAAMHPKIRADIMSGDPLRRDMALARISMGTMIIGSAAMMASAGMLTGGGPKRDDKGIKDALRRKGWQPYSLKIGDTYYSFSRTDPIGMFLGVVADIADVNRYGGESVETEEIIAGMTMAVAENLTSKTYLRGISDLLETVNSGSEKTWQRYINRMGATLFPATSLSAAAARAVDPVVRDTNSLMDKVRSRIPGLSSELPPLRNLWGEPIVLEGGAVANMISPVYTSTGKYSPVDDEIIENEMDIRMPPRTLGSGHFAVEMTPEQYSRFAQITGAEPHPETGLTLKEYLKELMGEEAYKDATPGPDGMKTQMFRRAIAMYRDRAKRIVIDEHGLVIDSGPLFEEFPELQEDVVMEEVRRREAKGISSALNN